VWQTRIRPTKPIREFATPRVTSVGNPELDPQFTNSIELNYTKTIKRNIHRLLRLL
jgi:hypothetical protein